MEEIEYIELHFENCDFCKIPVNLIRRFYMGGVLDNWYLCNTNQFSSYKSCNDFFIEIKNEALSMPTWFAEDMGLDIDLKKQLGFRDIAQVHIKTKARKETYWAAPPAKGLSFNSPNQLQVTTYKDSVFSIEIKEKD